MNLAGKWEFPGGKMEPGESTEACILREILEELNISILITKPLPSFTFVGNSLSIRLIPFLAAIHSGEISLTEHSEFA